MSLPLELNIFIYIPITIIAVELPNVVILHSQFLFRSIKANKQNQTGWFILQSSHPVDYVRLRYQMGESVVEVGGGYHFSTFNITSPSHSHSTHCLLMDYYIFHTLPHQHSTPTLVDATHHLPSQLATAPHWIVSPLSIMITNST